MRCLTLALALVFVIGCEASQDPTNPVLVRVGKVDIRARDLQARAPEVIRPMRAQLAALPTLAELKKSVLNLVIKDEAMWQEVVRRGYDKRGGTREQMMDKLLEDEIRATNPPYELPDADIARYYADHIDSMGPPGARASLAEAAPGIRALLKRTLIERKKSVLSREIALKLRGDINFIALTAVTFPPGLLPPGP